MGTRIVALMLVCFTSAAGAAHAQSPSPFDQLAAGLMPSEERFDGQPKGLIAVLGSNRGRHWHGINAVAHSPDGKYLACAQSNSVILWDHAMLQEWRVLRVPPDYLILAVSFAPDSQTLA